VHPEIAGKLQRDSELTKGRSPWPRHAKTQPMGPWLLGPRLMGPFRWDS
jgi:hypothetical protein